MRWLCISDVQGDLEALTAVLATAESRGYSKLLCAGDICFPGPAPMEVWRRLTQQNAVMVQGVTDRALAALDPKRLKPQDEHEERRLSDFLRVKKELGELVVERLARLPEGERFKLPNGGELLLTHGSPVDASEPFSHEMTDDELRALIGSDPADVIVCGGSHVPFDRTVMDVRIINVGSVGDALGSPRHANASLLEFVRGGADSWTLVVDQFSVPLEADEDSPRS